MYEKKNLAMVITALVVIIAASLIFYNVYKDRIDPTTGEITQTLAVSKSEATDFIMQDANGEEVKLSDFEGTPVVLNFWTSWCSFCKSEMPYFESAFEEYGDKVDFIMLNVVQSERNSEDGREFIEESDYTFPVFYETEGEVTALYGLRGFPSTVFIDEDGNIVKRVFGEISEEELSENINTLIEEE